jgi:hypothetical protein
MMKRIVLAAATLAAFLAMGGAAQASVHPAAVNHPAAVQTAVTQITDRPDSGAQGNDWADDNFSRTAVVHLINEVAPSFCPGTLTGHCYLWAGSITDSGSFTTIAGQLAPRTGTLDTAVTGTMHGGATHISFYASWKSAKASRVPLTENDGGVVPTGRHTTTNWVEQFFGASTVFNSAANPGGPDLGTPAGWTYKADFGSNSACPLDAYSWVDAAPSWGALNSDGNILAPNAADCT